MYIICTCSAVLHTIGISNTSWELRLVGDTENGVGIVEVATLSGPATICPDTDWTDIAARSVCESLGYESGVSIV